MTSKTTQRKPFGPLLPQKAAGIAAIIGLAGSVFLSLAPAASADPPSSAPAWGRRDDTKNRNQRDDHRNDRRPDNHDDRRDNRRDDHQNDRRDDHNNNWRNNDQRRDDHNNDRRDDWRNNNRYNSNDRYTQQQQQDANRQKNKNDWRNLTLLGGAATVYGLLNHDPTVTFLGAAGTLYSASRYDHDRKSQSQTDRARAEVFDRGNFERDGVRYSKHDRWVNGQHFYYFAR